jgi:superfamily II DNA or RNA helicase
LAYRAEEREQAKNFTYQEEIDYLVSHERRSNFICKLALAQTSNTLILYQFVDKHGKKLHETLQKMNKDQNRKIFFISGDVEGEIREDMRQAIEKEPNAIIVASYGTFSTGINIRSLTNIIFASPSKGRIRVLQSIGRQLRKNVGKETAQLYDISDDLSHKSRQNYGIKHLMERIKIYGEEKFDFKMTKVEV